MVCKDVESFKSQALREIAVMLESSGRIENEKKTRTDIVRDGSSYNVIVCWAKNK